MPDNIVNQSDCYKRNLFRNLRNPEKIVIQANKLYPELGLPVPTRSLTTKPKKYIISSDEELSILSKLIRKILDEGAKSDQISILTFKSQQNSLLKNVKTICGKRVVNINNFNEDDDVLVWSEISSFKGLENHFIFVIEYPTMELDTRLKSLCYVSFTRAISDYYILCYKDTNHKAI